MRDRLDSTGHSFQAYFKRATSPLVVLRLLMEKPMYGYELTQEMKQRSGGAFTISVLYPVLYRLQEQGYVEITRSEVTASKGFNSLNLGTTTCSNASCSLRRLSLLKYEYWVAALPRILH